MLKFNEGDFGHFTNEFISCKVTKGYTTNYLQQQ